MKKSELIDEMQTAEFETFLGQYHDVFSLEDGERGETDLTEMVIETGDSPPRKVPACRMPLAVRREVARQLRDMQSMGIGRSDFPKFTRENCFLSPTGSIRIPGHALWTHQCTCGVPEVDGAGTSRIEP